MRKNLIATLCLIIVGLLIILPVVPEIRQAQSAADTSVAGAVYEHSPVSVVDDAYEQPGNAAGEVSAGPSGLPPAESAPETVASGCYETLPETVASVVYEVYANVLVIEGDTPVKIVRAMNEITKEYPNVKFVAWSNEQALADPELENLIRAADLIYLDRASSQLTERIKNLASLLAGKKVIVFNSPPRLTRLSSIGSFDFEGAEKAIAEINEAREVKTVNELVYAYPQLAPYLEAKKYALSDTGGLENYRNMFLYLLNQTVPTVVYAAYQMVPEQFIYYRGSIYPDLESCLPLLDPGRPAVGILAWAPQTYQVDDLVLLDGLIASLEERGLNVICLLTRQKEVTGIRQVFCNAEAIINLLPFDLPLPAELLRDLNIPVFRPVVLNQEPADQEEISLSLPLQADAQGQIEPLLLAVAKTKRDECTGLLYRQLVPVNGRLDCLGERVFNWLRLRKLANSEKRIALVFYNLPPGKQNIGARYLAVPDSILSILDTLKENGYRVENVPATPAELLNQIYEKGINVGSWTPGKLKELADKATLIPGEEYREWFQKLPPVLQKEVVEGPFGYLEEIARLALAEHEQDEAAREIARWKDQLLNVLADQEKAAELVEMAAQTVTRMVYLGGHGTVDEEVYGLGEQLAALKNEFLALRLPGLTGWGEPPGTQMTVKREGKDYLVIPGIYFGNVFVAPQPLPGFDDPGMLYHNPVIPPPHQYLAFYAWLNKNFHAVVHLG
ncbi:MAG: cobaltochelatase subunit CobN, partial [Armatimonadetes bacterium]|nr:cobaltochelatase subunit CobN [Armatimonadota bacterium]